MNFPLTDIKTLSSATRAFVLNSESIQTVLGTDNLYNDLEKVIENKKSFKNREVLVETLLNQYKHILLDNENDELVKINIQLLKQENTFTVSTGQQLHLFFGPAFVLYKIIGIIDTCKALKSKHPQFNFVPIYWMASEDHDFDEIQKTTVFNKTFIWETDQKGACGRFHLEDVSKVIDNIKHDISLNSDQLEIINIFEKIYAKHKHLGTATAATIHYFFGSKGVVCIDGDDKAFKQLAIPLIKSDILENANEETFNITSEKMKLNDLSTQLHAREINFFYLDEQIRNRIIKTDSRYEVHEFNKNWSQEEMIDEIEKHPERFSPNAMLRPLFQETILPNIMYIGGNAEVNYWIQLYNNFKINDLTPPTLKLRSSVWIIPQKLAEKAEKANISLINVLKLEKEEDLLTYLEEDKQGIDALITEFQALKERAQTITSQYISKELKGLVDLGKTYEKQLKMIDKMIIEQKLNNNKKEIEKIWDLHINYLNTNKIQERTISALEMLIKYGNPWFLSKKNCELSNSNGHLIKI